MLLLEIPLHPLLQQSKTPSGPLFTNSHHHISSVLSFITQSIISLLSLCDYHHRDDCSTMQFKIDKLDAQVNQHCPALRSNARPRRKSPLLCNIAQFEEAMHNRRRAIELREISIIALLTTFQACNIGSCALIAVEWVTLSTKRSSRNSYF